MPPFKDYFSEHAKDYAAYRPDYPPSLFDFLASLVNQHEYAWDCGTGNGQAAFMLANYFKQVIATDPSAEQIQAAPPKANIIYKIMPAEKTNIANQSIDLITVAQALHWFDFAKFYREAERVLKSDGILAAWTYNLMEVDPAVDKIIGHLYHNITYAYWAPERKHCDDNYINIPFPLNQINSPKFFMEKNWNLQQVINYLSTWSGLRSYQQKTGIDPLQTIAADLENGWGDPATKKLIRWPVSMLVGKF